MNPQKYYTLITLLSVALSVGCSSSGSGRVVNRSETRFFSGLAPWTENKPVDERYQVMSINEESTPFTGRVVAYGYILHEGKGRHSLDRIEVYRNGETIEVTFYEPAEPLKLVNGQFRNVIDQNFPEQEVAVYKKAHLSFSKESTRKARHQVLELKEWSPNGQLILHGKNGKSSDDDPVSYDSIRDDLVRSFDVIKHWDKDGKPVEN